MEPITTINSIRPTFDPVSQVQLEEHRFYGQSVPFGSLDIAMADVEVRGCLTVDQALMDFAGLIKSLKQNLSCVDSPVFVIGGSYSGLLAAWFRMIFPHIAHGAVASSAPIFYSEDDVPPERQYCSIVSKDFEDTNTRCYDDIRKSWTLIDNIAAQVNGIDTLNQIFPTCSPLLSSQELKVFLGRVYSFAAQYSGRFNHGIKTLCEQIEKSNDVLQGISDAVLAMSPNATCFNLTLGPPFVLDPQSQKAWDWQSCTQLMAHESCVGDNMFPPKAFNIAEYNTACELQFNVVPHPQWLLRMYGGQDPKSALKNSTSYVAFTNGLRDPLSGSGVLEDISDTVLAFTTREGSHCLDLNALKSDDPKWLKHQRLKVIKLLTKWNKHFRSSSNHSNRIGGRKILASLMIAIFLGV